jgi:hypothetical protein
MSCLLWAIALLKGIRQEAVVQPLDISSASRRLLPDYLVLPDYLAPAMAGTGAVACISAKIADTFALASPNSILEFSL